MSQLNLNNLIARTRVGLFSSAPSMSTMYRELIAELNEVLGCHHGPKEYTNAGFAKSLLLPRTNYQLTVIKTAQEPRYTLRVGHRAVLAKHEALAFVLMALMQRMPSKQDAGLKYDQKGWADILGKSSTDRLDISEHRYFTQHAQFVHRDRLVFIIYEHLMIYFARNETWSPAHKLKELTPLTTPDGRWIRRGPWIEVAEQTIKDIIAENDARAVERKAAEMAQAIDTEHKLSADLAFADRTLTSLLKVK